VRHRTHCPAAFIRGASERGGARADCNGSALCACTDGSFIWRVVLLPQEEDILPLGAVVCGWMGASAHSPGAVSWFFRMPRAEMRLIGAEHNIMIARRLSAEEWIAELDSIIDQYREARIPTTRKQAIDRLVQLGFSEGDAVRYLDRNRAKPAVSHK
jgi:hypothetical protein